MNGGSATSRVRDRFVRTRGNERHATSEIVRLRRPSCPCTRAFLVEGREPKHAKMVQDRPDAHVEVESRFLFADELLDSRYGMISLTVALDSERLSAEKTGTGRAAIRTSAPADVGRSLASSRADVRSGPRRSHYRSAVPSVLGSPLSLFFRREADAEGWGAVTTEMKRTTEARDSQTIRYQGMRPRYLEARWRLRIGGSFWQILGVFVGGIACGAA